MMKNNKSLLDHTLIGSEIEKSIKIYKWDYILSQLPAGSFLVGGYLRDFIINKIKRNTAINVDINIDLDIIVPKNAYEVGQNIAEKYKGKLLILDKDREIVRVILKGLTLDIAPQISNSLYVDIYSRDFTINSISFSLDKNLIFDPLNGIKDIEKSLIRTYQKKNLVDDPLRILRCFRFVSELDFHIDKNLIEFIRIYKNKLSLVSVERIQYELRRIIRGKYALKSILLINQMHLFEWMQSYESSFYLFLKDINLQHFYLDEIEKYTPIFYLIETLNDFSIQNLKFSKSLIAKTFVLRKWKDKLIQKPINELDEMERFELHKDLESILPAFIIYLPEKDQLDWLNRWRNREDKLFHPTNLLDGDTIKKYIKINDGPLLGQLLSFLSMELAYRRIKNLDEAIYKAEQWFQQNAPKYD